MKTTNKLMILLLSMIMPIGVIGCSDDDDNGQKPHDSTPELIIEQEVVNVKIGPENKATLNVKEGGGEYSAFVLDETLAKAEVVDGEIKIEGFANGQTAMIVSDKYSRYRRVPVKVYTTDVLQLSHERFELVIPLGYSRTRKANVVLGNDGYKIASDNPDVKVTINEAGEITVTATSKKEEVTANLTITDSSGLSANMIVAVIATLEPYTEEELNNIMNKDKRIYMFNNAEYSRDAYTYINEVLPDGKNRYGYTDSNPWGANAYFYIDFSGDKNVGLKENAIYTYYYVWAEYYGQKNYDAQPITLKVIKNDGTNIWGVFSFVDEEEEKLCYGYFCDTINP